MSELQGSQTSGGMGRTFTVIHRQEEEEGATYSLGSSAVVPSSALRIANAQCPMGFGSGESPAAVSRCPMGFGGRAEAKASIDTLPTMTLATLVRHNGATRGMPK